MNQTGMRVKDAIGSSRITMNQAALARAVGMGSDALSRSLSGQRKFSAAELARLAAILGVSLPWLITGIGDPSYESGKTAEQREESRDRIAETVAFPAAAYREIGLETPPLPVFAPETSPEDAADSVAALLSERFGQPFIHDLPAAIEAAYGLGVFIVAEGPAFDARSMNSGSVSYIVVRGTGAWFQGNLVLARELGYLLCGSAVAIGRRRPSLTTWADYFAFALLLPVERMRGMDWNRQTPNELARFLWESGISAKALAARLNSLGIRPGPALVHADEGTLQLLAHQVPDCLSRPRARAYRSPRIPQSLLEEHLKALRDGQVDGSSLAWMLDTPLAEL
ncbi:helix-turn-helix domain-containing protein [Paeniglutamicibacter cryotolerans]|uniref:Transcriptional regulator with XRE-family HTH domain n=1 Tax=Paeniglutamicibacter cryotolerans TaxID=670079 RepID=A0A839R036_9MICC|nr:XRE family transcriptional regulator [Paeniglutamicibacter cryotolerans]MBB2997601.1 transcriptional regulator with XRE-family HTH domain [Paeniglutamicibacter cryotolerans]